MDRFAELFSEAMPAGAESVYAELGLTPERVSELGVEPGNTPALRLYERAGFERVGERLGFLIMRKRL